MAKKRRGGMPKGFVSKAQWRFFYASPKLRKYAHKEAHKTMARRGGIKVAYHSLPYHTKGISTSPIRAARGRRGKRKKK
jgi:hypothetical protein